MLALTQGMRLALGAGAVLGGAVALYVTVAGMRETATLPVDTTVPSQEAAAPEATAAADLPATDISTPEVSDASDLDPEAEAPVTMEAPAFDVVRIEADGSGIVAGTAAAGMMVAILLDNAVVNETAADGSGRFVEFLDLGASLRPRVLSLMADPTGEAVPSEATIIIAPTAAAVEPTPQQLAEAEVSPEPPASTGDVPTSETQAATAAEPDAMARVTEPEASIVQDAPPEIRLAETGAAMTATIEQATELDVAEDVARVAQDEAAERASNLEEAGAAAAEVTVAETAAPLTAPSTALPTASPTAPPTDPAPGEDVMAEVSPVVVPDAAPEGVAEAAPEVVAEVAPEAAPEVVAEVVPEAALQATQDAAAQTSAEDAPQSAASVADTVVVEAVTLDVPVEVASDAPGVADPASTAATPDVATAPVQGPEAQGTDGQNVGLAAPPGIEAAPIEVKQPRVALDAPGIAAPEVETATTPPVLIADAEGVRVLQPARASEVAPEVLRTVALDTISYDDSGEVTVAGRATSAGSVRVYLDNAPVAEAPISEIGTWSTLLRDVPTGVYTLRVDQLDPDGAVLSRIETPFLREERETIAAVMAEDTERQDFSVAVRTVQPGNTLWAIARDRYGEGILYVAVFEANKDLIRDPDLIYPGQIFRLPELEDGQSTE